MSADSKVELLGHYRLQRLLGEGRFGEVYLAEDPDGTRFAIKVLRKEVCFPDIIARFKREAQLASRVRSPYVASVLDGGQGMRGRHWIAFEYIEGEDLATRFTREKTLPIDQVGWILDHVLQGLEHAHAVDVLHRDISIRNVMLRRLPSGEERATIIDFGVSTAPDLTVMTGHHEFVGQRAFAAPEQIEDPSRIGVQADLYSAGVVAFVLLTGKLPYEVGPAIRVPMMMPYSPTRLSPKSLGDVTGARWPEALESFFHTILRPRPEERFRFAREAREQWRHACGL